MLNIGINNALYGNELYSALEGLNNKVDKIEYIVRTLLKARRYGKNIFIIGNGGSASTAIHFASDLNKGAKHPLATNGFRARALTENISDLTAIANDVDYDSVFLDQLINQADSGDILIAISCSGNSKNVINAVKWFKTKNSKTISLTGFCGGELANITDVNINVDSENIRVCEDLHLMLCHMISFELSNIPDFCVFIDRDGTLCPDKHYLSNPNELEIYNSASSLRKLSDLGIPIFIITNQSGINRGIFSEKTLDRIHERLLFSFEHMNIEIEDLLFCPHLPEEKCWCRKPNPGMALKIYNEWFFDLTQCFVVGDSDMDEGLAMRIGARFIESKGDCLDTTVDKILSTISGRLEW